MINSKGQDLARSPSLSQYRIYLGHKDNPIEKMDIGSYFSNKRYPYFMSSLSTHLASLHHQYQQQQYQWQQQQLQLLNKMFNHQQPMPVLPKNNLCVLKNLQELSHQSAEDFLLSYAQDNKRKITTGSNFISLNNIFYMYRENIKNINQPHEIPFF